MKRLLPFLLFVLICATSINAQNINFEGQSPKTNNLVMDISGNYAVVGIPFYTNENTDNKMGEAFIYCKDASGWKIQAKLTAPDISNCNFYGAAVAIYGDYCVVSAVQKAIDIQSKQGKIYIYKRSGIAWNLESTKTATIDNEQFGYSVDISENSAKTPIVAIGAPNANNGKGKVYTYIRNNTNNNWDYFQTIAPKDLTANNKFGLCVSIDKDCLAVGAPNQDYAVYDIIAAGAVYVFTLDSNVFSQQQKLIGYYPNGEFGYTLSLSGNKMAICSPWASSYGSTSSTSVVVLTKTDNKWNDAFSGFDIPNDKNGNSNQCSLQLSINDNQLLIGTPTGILFPGENPTVSSLNTLAYLYATSDGGATYHLKEEIVADKFSNISFLGHSTALDAMRK